ncbi:epimerase [Phaeobacter gallaeciensis]|uniref:Epimerase n=2 Tax=Roseobacteraceae TaxID=2854170 RepID=A0A366X9M0_9RHOB|nr:MULTISPECIES: NAD-dependent epimerase/dehydratase family protein [Roseobacteraceae]MBT3140480.1 NAD-dependent epimerase/dehydratase family protein [Falsiruegeria litorea]MBT8169655.1 NAD-dependent epimerase/dehydratase family protein [Falsiruegeria litorea]RBW62211.1 epimerase [Phaeobacter gallaeciensis]
MSELKTAFVTGANGYVGSHVVRHLLAQGYAVTAMVRTNSNLDLLEGTSVTRVEIDLALPRQTGRLTKVLHGIDLIIHTAAYVDLGTVDRTLMKQVNLEGTRVLLEAAQSAGVPKFIYCSTVRTLGDTAGARVDGDHVRTDTDYASCYDETKTQAEALVLARNRAGFSTYSVLPPGIFGRDEPHFGRALRAYLNGHLPFWPAQDRPLGMVHVEDLAELFFFVAHHGIPGTRYIASAGEATMGEIFGILGEMTGRKPPPDMPESLVRAAAMVMDWIGSWTGRNMILNKERIVFLYDKVVRTDPTRSYSDLGWNPRKPREILAAILPKTED